MSRHIRNGRRVLRWDRWLTDSLIRRGEDRRTRPTAGFRRSDPETLSLSILYAEVVDAPVLIGGTCRTVFELVSAVTDATAEQPARPQGLYDRGAG